MPIELTRAHLLIGVFVASVLVLIGLSGHTASPPVISPWLPSQPARAAAAAPPGITGDAQPLMAGGQAGASSLPLSLAGDVGFNVLAALDASSGALRNVTIRPGETWSFNATVGSPAQVAVRAIAGVPGGGWCDLASRYVQAVRPLLPRDAVQFVNHVATSGIRLADVADDDAVSIWNINGQPGSAGQSQDLQITNTLAAPLHLQVVEQPGQQVVVRAMVGDS
jgi:hypothetical protein